jgi:hypothetical protein
MHSKLFVLTFALFSLNLVLCERDTSPAPVTFLERLNRFQDSDFFFDFEDGPVVNAGGGGLRRQVSVKEIPALQGLGVSSVIFQIAPCGINFPHIHPRATELFHVLEGEFLSGLVLENPGKLISR